MIFFIDICIMMTHYIFPESHDYFLCVSYLRLQPKIMIKEIALLKKKGLVFQTNMKLHKKYHEAINEKINLFKKILNIDAKDIQLNK